MYQPARPLRVNTLFQGEHGVCSWLLFLFTKQWSCNKDNYHIISCRCAKKNDLQFHGGTGCAFSASARVQLIRLGHWTEVQKNWWTKDVAWPEIDIMTLMSWLKSSTKYASANRVSGAKFWRIYAPLVVILLKNWWFFLKLAYLQSLSARNKHVNIKFLWLNSQIM